MAQTRNQKVEQTRGRLIAAARQAFATKGYAEASMDDFTADVGLTRGALYHHFGNKQGLLKAVIEEIDHEMSDRLRVVFASAPGTWQGFIDESVAYMEMALEPEIQRIVLLDGPAVLGSPSQWSNQCACLHSTMECLEQLMNEGAIRPVNTEATARLLNGATLNAALWIAGSEDPHASLEKAVDAFRSMADGLKAVGWQENAGM